MTEHSEEFEQITSALRQQFNTEIKWRYDEKFDAMLSEFSQMTSLKVIPELQKIFPHEWNMKNINTTPLALFDQLNGFNKLTKLQLIFTIPAQNSKPAFVAILWPWGHGGTYSLRLKPLESSYNMDNIRTPFSLSKILKSLFGKK